MKLGLTEKIGLGVVLAGTALVALSTYTTEVAPTQPGVTGVVATVDGVPVPNAAVDRLVASGLDRVNAVDRAINQVVASNIGHQRYAAEIKQQLQATEAEVGAAVYLQKEMASAVTAITDDEVQKRFNTEVAAADFRGYQLLFAMYPDPATAEKALAGMQKGDAASLKQLQPMIADNTGAPGYVAREGIPYNMGVLVAKMRAGDYLGPTVVRNGVLILKLQAVKEGTPPEFSQVKEALRQRMADELVTRRLADARKAAKIELK